MWVHCTHTTRNKNKCLRLFFNSLRLKLLKYRKRKIWYHSTTRFGDERNAIFVFAWYWLLTIFSKNYRNHFISAIKSSHINRKKWKNPWLVPGKLLDDCSQVINRWVHSIVQLHRIECHSMCIIDMRKVIFFHSFIQFEISSKTSCADFIIHKLLYGVSTVSFEYRICDYFHSTFLPWLSHPKNYSS